MGLSMVLIDSGFILSSATGLPAQPGITRIISARASDEKPSSDTVCYCTASVLCLDQPLFYPY